MPGIVSARGSFAAFAQVLGDGVLRDPAGDALADRDPELVGGLVDVFADLALHRDRDELVRGDPVDPDVVVVDELAQLGGDGDPDLVDAGQAVEARPELLDRLELGRPRRHPLEVLGGPDRDAGLGRQGGHGLELVVGPRVRPVVVDVEQPEQLGPVEAAAPCRSCRSPPGRPRHARPRRAGRCDSRPRTAAGGRRPPAAGSDWPGTHGRSRDSSPTGRGSPRPRRCRRGAWRKTAPGRLRTGPSHGRPGPPGSDRGRGGCRCRSRPGCRASTRWSWWATSSALRATTRWRPVRRR